MTLGNRGDLPFEAHHATRELVAALGDLAPFELVRDAPAKPNLMTFSVRYDASDDGGAFDHRRAAVAELAATVRRHGATQFIVPPKPGGPYASCVAPPDGICLSATREGGIVELLIVVAGRRSTRNKTP